VPVVMIFAFFALNDMLEPTTCFRIDAVIFTSALLLPWSAAVRVLPLRSRSFFFVLSGATPVVVSAGAAIGALAVMGGVLLFIVDDEEEEPPVLDLPVLDPELPIAVVPVLIDVSVGAALAPIVDDDAVLLAVAGEEVEVVVVEVSLDEGSFAGVLSLHAAASSAAEQRMAAVVFMPAASARLAPRGQRADFSTNSTARHRALAQK